MKLDDKPVVLLQPPDLCKTFTRSGSVYPPLGLCQLAAVDINNVMQVIDAEGEGLSDNQTEILLRNINPKIVGLSATSFTLEIVERWAKFCKTINATVIVGGPHPSLSPLNTFEKCPSVDFLVRGEGEIVINQLVEQILDNSFDKHLPGVCSRLNDDFHIDPVILKTIDFAELPFPDLSYMPIKNYWCPDAINRPMVTMITTKGCPYSCEFCSSPVVMGKKVRGWSVERVITELKYLHFELGVKEISFVDDVFTISRKRILELCSEILRHEIDISWFCNARADHIDDEIARAMKLSGCHQTYLGFESGSQTILDNIRKGTSIERLIKGAEILKDHGIDRSIGFVLGLPGENEESVLKSIQLAQKLQPERLQFTRFTPLVGSPLENFRMHENGFHKRGDDQVGIWIKKAYEECHGHSWGKESW